MQLLLESHRIDLLANGRRRILEAAYDPVPVIKLFTPDAGATWLLSELDPADPDLAFGLCDPGLGHPELGHVRLSDLASLRGAIGLPVERDLHFSAVAPLSAYARAARRSGRIVTDTAAICEG